MSLRRENVCVNRRAFLALGAAGIGGLAGCPGGSQTDSQTVSETTTRTPASTVTATATPTRTSTEQHTPTETPRENPETIFVHPGGDDDNPGTRNAPIQRLQTALNRVRAGETVYALPGVHRGPAHTRRGGTAEAPIRITGPPEAVFRSDRGLFLNHSHVHLTGLSIDGLVHPDRPDDPTAYAETLVKINAPLTWSTEDSDSSDGSVPEERFVRDIVCKPHAIGNCRADLIKVNYSRNVEIGEFRLAGPVGVKFSKGEKTGHNAEIVYVGNPPSGDRPLDRSRNVHIHHIDASAGHVHGELVDLKPGTHHCTVEYCTSLGGGLTTDDAAPTVVGHNGHHNVVRWNEIGDCAIPIRFDGVYADLIYENDIYGNYLHEYTDTALAFENRDEIGLEQQRHICENEVAGDAIEAMTADCEADVPAGDGIGHLGGASPWA